MDQNQNVPQSVQPENTFPSAASPEKSSAGMVIGVIALVVVLAGIGWFMVGQNGMGMMSAPSPVVATQPTNTGAASTTNITEDAAATALATQGSSDEIGAINADLKTTDLNSLNDIDKI